MRLGDRDRQLLRIVAVLLAIYLAMQVFAQIWQAVAIVADVLLIFVVAFLMLIVGRAMWERLLMRLPPQRRAEAEILRESTDRAFGGFVRGSLLLGTIYGIATFIILLALRVPFEGVLAIVSGLTVIIPFFGPIIAIILVLGVTAR